MSEQIDASILNPAKTLIIPLWLFWLAFVSSIIISLIGIIKAASVLFRAKTLNVTLTREIFFRISDYGECFFPNIVVIARNGLIETKDIKFKLVKIKTDSSAPHKEYSVGPLLIGERVVGSNPIASNHFYTSSPLFFIEPGTSKRMVLMTVIEGYLELLKQETRNFETEIIELKKQGQQAVAGGLIQKDDSVATKFFNICTSYASKIGSHIQLEPGKYEMTVIIDYRALSIWSKTKCAKSVITFEVPSNFKNDILWKIENSLMQRARHLLTDEVVNIEYPEFFPVKVKEI